MKPKKAAAVASRDEEWVPSSMGEVKINRMVEVGVLSYRVTALHITIFIHFYEAYLGVLPHFNLFRHLF